MWRRTALFAFQRPYANMATVSSQNPMEDAIRQKVSIPSIENLMLESE